MKKILSMLKDRTGSSLIGGAAVACFLFVVCFVIFEVWHLYIVELGIRDDVQSAITSSCTENYDRLYNGIREGYSGGYKQSGGNWVEDIDSGDVYAKLDKLLGTQAEGAEHVKYTDGKTAYIISDLTIQMSNTPFAPEDPEAEPRFTGVAYLTLRVSLGFGWGAIPPLQVHMKVIAGYMAKF